MSFEVKEIKFAQDTEQRRKWFRAASFSHPAKMVLGLQIYLIEHYTKVGETILDPMAGSGTVLVGCALGRNVICVELEQKFCKMIEANWQKIKSLGPMLGYKMGEATILQGDARNLDNLLINKRFCNQAGNLPYGEISAVISSPPYNEEPTVSESYKRFRSKIGRDTTKPSQQYAKYADAVITSPPYEGSLETSTRNTKGGISARDPKLGQTGTYGDLDPSVKRLRKHGRNTPGGPYGKSLAHPYSGAEENIGNLKSENYLEAMLSVYQNCHRVLKEKGLLVLVVKNFIRRKKLVRLDTDTVKLCEKAGFTLIERLKRKLTSQSFWRIIYQRKFPDAPKIEFEDILIFTTPGPDGSV